MDRDVFINLVFATHRVADILPEEGKILQSCIKSSANRVLTDLLIFSEEGVLQEDQRSRIAPRILQEIEILYGYFRQAREWNWIAIENFLILQGEYNKVKEHLALFLREQAVRAFSKEAVAFPARPQREEQKNHEIPKERALVRPQQQAPRKEVVLPDRQRKIVELLKSKERVQIWELQNILPDVTKRTLRRDMDDLLSHNLIERTGEWNTVSYQLKK
ncbi:MAG: DeoR family transcriptional regulator [Candidatus Yanofskybacteria bacterium]|nr:DeoR family transcriptional regulator [Candidatus Yanofskybacteria bacterium]